ncbi:MAG: hypothetical protein ACE5J2_07725 [Nitrososphaerales archaeon]
MRGKLVFGVALSAILLFGTVATALAQEDKFSARLLAKGKRTNILILVKNSSKSTQSIYEFEVTFIKGNLIKSISRGWDTDTNGNTVTFSAKKNPIKPGARAIFLIKVSNPAQSAFTWTVSDKDGNELQSGEMKKIRIREKRPISPLPKITTPEISVDQVKVKASAQIIVTGKGFNADVSITLLLDQMQLGSSKTNSAGEFSTVVIIPSGAAYGLHLIKATDALGKSSVIQILIELPEGAEIPQPGQLILSVRTDRAEYDPGDVVQLSGTAVLDSPVSLQIVDPIGGVICGANPPVNNVTYTWSASCPVPLNAVGGKYVVTAKQIVHKTSTTFTVISTITGGKSGAPGALGEDPGTLKLSTDKESYKVGETVQITLEGARAQSIVQIVIDGPGRILHAERVSTNENGVVTITYSLVGAEVGTWKYSAKQDKFVVRATFEVTA